MVQYLEDDRNGHLYGRHVVAAIKRVRSLSGSGEGMYDMREVMASFVAKLTFREMCVVLKEQKNWRQVRDFFAWMKLQLSYRPSVMVYTIVLRAYGQVGKIRLAEETFLEMLEAGCEPDEVACGTMLCSYARWGRHKALLSFYSAVQERKIVPSVSVFNFMLSSLQKKSRHSDVIYIWRQMINNQVAPNQFTYTVVIGSLMKGDMADEAFHTFNEMKNLGFLPEESTYSLLINSSSKQGDKDKTFNLYEDMRSQGIVPSNFTCASLLALYYKNGDYSKACSLFTEMERYGVIADEVIFGIVIRIYGKLGLYEDAQKTFKEIERSCQLNDDKTYITMAQVHLNYGSVEKALAVMEQMKSNKISFSRFSFIVLLQCYIMKGDIPSAEITYQALSNTGLPDTSSSKDMLKLYLRLGLYEKAKDFTAQLRKNQVEFDEELFKMVMKFYCRSGMLREVEELMEELSVTETSKGISSFQTFRVVMNGQCGILTESGNRFDPLDQSGALVIKLMLILCLAVRNEQSMKKKLELLLKTKIGQSVANQVISNFSEEGDMLTTKYLYEIMMKLGCRLEDSAKASMISMYGKLRMLTQAQEVFAADAVSIKASEVLHNSMLDAYIACNKEEDAHFFYKEQTRKGHIFSPVSVSVLVNALAKCDCLRVQKHIKTCWNKHLPL